ncbi:hypothetical protein MATR_04240 [Marivirga tractuosa]|uniref:Uncharacterized protein n=1 Tax=Marivirga tractuosa (strain ATCC 23168 / DSM 4126 / NBRC 15989 / NCIMB 1408 / VKM B-1430 / H-43) TaxID=643867 RepID=E4TTB2_MARTH|nr:hypothetical protein [Marivirga tractuosa]ADR21942.1 hypothetical protein Ftrac_1957 [Marivirga tractuosa DSM 4126]BDD13599.1 hypothetical protein MATR_04240 [Marivirga tractuosa]
MNLFSSEHQLESKEKFSEKIREHFLELTDGKLPNLLFNDLCELITNYQYDQNKRFWKQYPKSRKRYSQLKIEDLNHPFIQYLIIDYLKPMADYRTFAKILLNMNDEELSALEVSKHQYETK